MALKMLNMAMKPDDIVRSSFDLPTYQRRLRHLRSLTLRNLQCRSYHGRDITKLQVFFTLHMAEREKEFYTSEIISGSLNPTWQSFDISRFEEEIDTHEKSVWVRVWIGSSSKKDRPKLLLDWWIHLTGLAYFSDKLQHDKYKYAPNTLMLGMYDKYFKAPEHVLPTGDVYYQVDPSIIRSSYTINSLSRIHTVLRAIKQMQASVKRVHRSIEDKLLSSQEKTKKLSQREDMLLRVRQLKSELAWQMSKLQHQGDVLEHLTHSRQESSNTLTKKFEMLETNRTELRELKKQYFQTRESYIKENAQLLIRRKQLISELTFYIYPITETKNKDMCVCGVKLPNSEHFQGSDDTMCAVSLGYTCHLVMMISQILDFPLRYLMDSRGSRSLIVDHIHPRLSEKDKTFPLFTKGKEKFQFNYGVFLLNKNVSQLRFYCGLGTTDLRLTLPNIKSMLELRLGVKFDHQYSSQRSLLEVRDTTSNNSNERMETVSSAASVGKSSAPDPEVEALESALANESSPDSKKTNKKNKPISLNEITVKPVLDTENGDLFKPTNDGFFKVKTTNIDVDSCGNSSCGSMDMANGSAHSNQRDFTPSPLNIEENALTLNSCVDEIVGLTVSDVSSANVDEELTVDSRTSADVNCDKDSDAVLDTSNINDMCVSDGSNVIVEQKLTSSPIVDPKTDR